MNKKLTLIIVVIFITALARLLPHAPNFSPLAAIALFGGAYIANKYLAIAIPLLAMLFSDALMGFNGWAFTEQVFVVYACFTMIAFLGFALQHNKSVLRVAGITLTASVLFFVLTNFAVWAGGFFHTPALYPLTSAGLVQCYVAAIPFFQNSLAGDFCFSTVLFGGFYLASINIPALKSSH